MPGNEGYINIVAAMQKFFDQSISGNWSYNPLQYENNEVPMSVMMKDLLTTYKLGWKTSYYQNTYDFKGDEDNVQPSGLEDTKIDNSANNVTMNGHSNGYVNGHHNGHNGHNGHSNGNETETYDAAEGEGECEACNI